MTKPSPRQRVLWALDQGWNDPRAIAIFTTLTLDRVRTELTRLKEKNVVRKCAKGYERVPKCELANAWK